MYKVIDVENWIRKSQYNWFSSFSNPCYGMDVLIDVTNVVAYSKQTKTSFFINFLYIVTTSLNCIDEMRLRIKAGEVREYSIINPTFTVMTKTGIFENAGIKMEENYHDFYRNCHEVIERVKNQDEISMEYNGNTNYDDYYITCTPWINYQSMTHPLPDNNPESSSVPRICWGKFETVEGKNELTLNITVSHALVDGFPLAKGFNLIQERSKKCFDIFK